MYNFHFSSIKLSIIFEERERERELCGYKCTTNINREFPEKKKNITEKKTRMYIYTHTYIYTFTLLHIRATFFISIHFHFCPSQMTDNL